MKEYYILSSDLFAIKVKILKSLMVGNSLKPLLAETSIQLRADLEQLKQELFGNVNLSAEDRKEIQKINEKILLRYAAIKRRLEKQAA